MSALRIINAVFWVLVWIALWNAVWNGAVLFLCTPMSVYEFDNLTEAGFKVGVVIGTFMSLPFVVMHEKHNASLARDAELDALERRPLKPFSYR